MRTLTALVVKASGRIRDTVGENRFYILFFPPSILKATVSADLSL